MALNFPADPSDGDVYEGYVWNDTVGAWQTLVEPTAPIRPHPFTMIG